MATVFESISDGFYTAFSEPDQDKRKEKIEAWIKQSAPVIQSAVESDLRAYLEGILEDTWTEEGWKARTEKYYGRSVRIGKRDELPFIDAYKVSLDVKIRQRELRKDIVVDTLTPEVRAKTNEAIETAKTYIAKLEPPQPTDLKEINLHDEGKYRVEMAIPLLEKFIYDCYRDNVRKVRIIHGKGIFVLQKAIRDYLGTHRFVKSGSISAADKDHGGEGATEANLVEFSANNLD